jgi:hypothetical protein
VTAERLEAKRAHFPALDAAYNAMACARRTARTADTEAYTTPKTATPSSTSWLFEDSSANFATDWRRPPFDHQQQRQRQQHEEEAVWRARPQGSGAYVAAALVGA